MSKLTGPSEGEAFTPLNPTTGKIPGDPTMALHFLTQELATQREDGGIVAAINEMTEAIKTLALVNLANGGEDTVSSRHTRVIALHAALERLGAGDESRRP